MGPQVEVQCLCEFRVREWTQEEIHESWHADTPPSRSSQKSGRPEDAQRRTPDGRGHQGTPVTEATWYRWLNQYGPKRTPRRPNGPRSWRRRTPGSSACWPRRNWPSTSSTRWPRKILSPEPRRRAVRMAVEKFGASERFACALLGQTRSSFRKKKPDMGFEEMQLRAALRRRRETPRVGLAKGPLGQLAIA